MSKVIGGLFQNKDSNNNPSSNQSSGAYNMLLMGIFDIWKNKDNIQIRTQ